MKESEYKELLEKAYEQLPEVLHRKGERFVVPEVSGRIVKSRTQISNFGDIAKYISREQGHMYKFMLKFLGVRGELNEDKGLVILFSRFQPAMLNKGVQKYFQEYVECPHCGSPDTVLQEGNSMKKCNACGHQEKVQQV